MDEGDKTGNGNEDYYLNEDITSSSKEYRAREVIQKYCAVFMPVEIFWIMRRQSF